MWSRGDESDFKFPRVWIYSSQRCVSVCFGHEVNLHMVRSPEDFDFRASGHSMHIFDCPQHILHL